MSDVFDELSARARRGELSRAEKQRLDVFLNGSVEARLWHDSGRALDAEGAVLPGDHEAVERVMQRVLAARPAKRARRRPGLGGLLVAALLLVVSVAAASVEGARYFRQHESAALARLSATKPAKKPTSTARATSVPASPAAMALPVASASPSAPAEVASLSPVEGLASARAKPRPEPSAEVAALFSAAALARREGNVPKAIALLDGLQERYPGSREARLGDMTLGALHLQRAAAAVALEHFRRYLRSAPQGELASEAIWGEYQALSALGQRAEAQHRLHLLVERFPGSTYAAAASSKLKSASP